MRQGYFPAAGQITIASSDKAWIGVAPNAWRRHSDPMIALQKKLEDDNMHVQAVLPGATATDFREVAGTEVSALPSATVMKADVMVDAALAGFDQRELVTIPSLPDTADWQLFEAARQRLIPNLSLSIPA